MCHLGLPYVPSAQDFRPVCQFVPVRTKEVKIKGNKSETKGIETEGI
jgi:hypothetical protein